MGIRSIHIAIVPSCKFLYSIEHLMYTDNEYSRELRIRDTSEALPKSQYDYWPSHIDRSPMGPG